MRICSCRMCGVWNTSLGNCNRCSLLADYFGKV
ncbi:RNA-dependent RNA-polymerase (plasmid) [Nostoc sp. C052]|nr:RNA-dependent RNA-polymerase [Nostoc sp. C052]